MTSFDRMVREADEFLKKATTELAFELGVSDERVSTIMLFLSKFALDAVNFQLSEYPHDRAE